MAILISIPHGGLDYLSAGRHWRRCRSATTYDHDRLEDILDAVTVDCRQMAAENVSQADVFALNLREFEIYLGEGV